MQVRIHLYSNDPTVEKSRVVGSDANCVPVVQPVKTAFNPEGGVLSLGGGTEISGSSVSSLASCGPYGNVIHSSHTLQDVVRIDIAWLRTSTDRIWNCNATWLHEENDSSDRVKAWSGTGPSWWTLKDPTRFGTVTWTCGRDLNCSNTWARVAVTFHTDFLHCNAINQDIKITETTVSYPDGSYYVDWVKNGSCPGVFSATATKANVSNLRSGGYGGSGRCVKAIADYVYWNPSRQQDCVQQS